jgi:hypothetical protein
MTKKSLIKHIVEDSPTMSMGTSSSSTGAGKITTFDPLMKTNKKTKILTRFKDLGLNDKRNRKSD